MPGCCTVINSYSDGSSLKLAIDTEARGGTVEALSRVVQVRPLVPRHVWF